MPGATPSLPTNAGKSPVNPAVCRCLRLWTALGVRHDPAPRGGASSRLTLKTLKNPMKQGVAQREPPLRHFAPRRHPFASALTEPCKRPPAQPVAGPEHREPPMPHLGSMPTPKEKPRTLLVGWISRLDLALELGVSVDTLRRWECRTGWRIRSKPPRAVAGSEGAGDGQVNMAR